jgi:hypothetical protein
MSPPQIVENSIENWGCSESTVKGENQVEEEGDKFPASNG